MANQSTFGEALRREKKREAKRKAMKRAKRLSEQKRLDDIQKEKERLQKLAEEIFSMAGYGYLNELQVLQNTPGFDEALNLPSRLSGEMPLLWAAANNELRTVEWLFAEKGCDLHVCDDHGRNICLKGAWRGHQRIIEYGYELGVDHLKKNICGEDMVHEAAYNGHTHVLKYCQSLGMPLDQENELGETPIMFSALNGHVEALAYFINVGTEEGGGIDGLINFYQLGYRGRNVIHYAALGGDKGVFRVSLGQCKGQV